MKNVRFSQMPPAVRQQYNAKLINILNAIMSICKDNDISCFVGYGACIGAVRHKGCIPWDDDIDVCMPRPDYERFLTACRNMNLGEFELATIADMPSFYEHFARIYDKNSTLYIGSHFKHVGGIFIDIFPLDGAGKGVGDKNVVKNTRRVLFWQAVLHQSHFYYKKSEFLKLLTRGKFVLFILVLITSLFRKRSQKISLCKIEKALKKYPYDKSDFVMFYERTYGLKNMIRKEWIEETILVPFENTQAAIPKRYDEYLTSIYGDYMTPPPEDKRDARHVFAYLDLERRFSYEELRKILSQ